jgi:hypothetical protein
VGFRTSTLFVLTTLWMSTAHAQGYFQCQPGQTRVQRGEGIQCQCPDGTYANYLSPCPNSQKLPPIDFNSIQRMTPHESKLIAALQWIGEKSQAARQGLFGSAPLSSIANQPLTVAPPPGFLASFEQQPKAAPLPPGTSPFTRLPEVVPQAPAQSNDLLNKAPIATMSPAKQPASPSKGSAVNCGAGQRPAAQGNFCELDPNQAPQNPAQSAPRPTGSYAACMALSSNTGFKQLATSILRHGRRVHLL